MTKGYDRRELIKDMNAQKSRASGRADTVPLSMVMSPQFSSSKGISKGKRSLADAIGSIKSLVDEARTTMIKTQKVADEKASAQAELDGTLANAQGMAESDAKAKGKFFHRGWLAHKANSLGKQIYVQGLNDIHGKYASMSTKDYRAEQMVLANNIQESIGDDPYARKMAASMVKEYLPRLVEEHVKTHSEWNAQETEVSWLSSLSNTIAAIDPTNPALTEKELTQLIQPGITGLPKAREYKALMGAIGADKTGTLMRVYEKSLDTKYVVTPQTFHAAGAAVQLDASTGTIGTYKMTAAQLKTPGLGVLPAQNNSAAEVNRVGREQLDAFTARYKNPVLIGLAKAIGSNKLDAELSRIGDPNDGLVTIDTFLNNLYIGDPAMEHLTGHGEPTEKQRAIDYALKFDSDFSKYSPKKNASTLYNKLLSHGATPDTIKKYQAMKIRHLKANGDKAAVLKYIETSTLDLASKSDQIRGMTLLEENANKQAAAKHFAGPDAEKLTQAYATHAYRKSLVKHNVIDPTLATAVSLQLTALTAVEKDGSVKKSVIRSLDTYKELYNLGGPEYASKYIKNKDNERFIQYALSLDEADVSSDHALNLAVIREQKLERDGPLKVRLSENETDNIDDAITNSISKMMYKNLDKVGFYTGMTYQEQDRAEASIENRITRDLIKSRTSELMQAGWSQKSAVNTATEIEIAKTAIVLGNVVRSGKFSDMYKDAGVESMKKYPEFFNSAISTILREDGLGWWKQYGPVENTEGWFDALKAWATTGIPNNMVDTQYDATRKLWIINLRDESNPDKYIGAPMYVPAEYVGKKGLAEHDRGAVGTIEKVVNPIKRSIGESVGSDIQQFTQDVKSGYSKVDKIIHETGRLIRKDITRASEAQFNLFNK